MKLGFSQNWCFEKMLRVEAIFFKKLMFWKIQWDFQKTDVLKNTMRFSKNWCFENNAKSWNLKWEIKPEFSSFDILNESEFLEFSSDCNLRSKKTGELEKLSKLTIKSMMDLSKMENFKFW